MRQFGLQGVEPVGETQAFGPGVGPLQQRAGAVQGYDPGAGELVGQQTAHDPRSTADVDDQSRLGLPCGDPGGGLPVQRREQLSLPLQMLGQLGPVDVGTVVMAVVVAVVVALLVPTLAVVVLSHDGEPSLPGAASLLRRTGEQQVPLPYRQIPVPIQPFSATR